MRSLKSVLFLLNTEADVDGEDALVLLVMCLEFHISLEL